MFDPPTRILDTLRGGEALLYRTRSPGFGIFSKEENFSAVSVPSPHLPPVRRGYGEKSVLTTQGTPKKNATLMIQVLGVPSQGMTVVVNGVVVAVVSNLTGAFEGFQIPFSYDESGKAVIEFRYALPSSNAVLFKALAVQDLPVDTDLPAR